MSKLLIIGRNNWADEIDLAFFIVLDSDEWEELKKNTQKSFKQNGSITIYIGTNEEIEFDSYDQWLRQFKVKEISEDEAKFLRTHFEQDWGFGAGHSLISGPAERLHE